MASNKKQGGDSKCDFHNKEHKLYCLWNLCKDAIKKVTQLTPITIPLYTFELQAAMQLLSFSIQILSCTNPHPTNRSRKLKLTVENKLSFLSSLSFLPRKNHTFFTREAHFSSRNRILCKKKVKSNINLVNFSKTETPVKLINTFCDSSSTTAILGTNNFLTSFNVPFLLHWGH